MELGGVVYPDITSLGNGHKEFRISYRISYEERGKLESARRDISDSREFEHLADSVFHDLGLDGDFPKVFYHFFGGSCLLKSCTVLDGSRGVFLKRSGEDGFYYESRGIEGLSEIPVWSTLLLKGLKLSDSLAEQKSS